MFLKSVVLLLVAVAVIAQAGLIYEPMEESEFELSLGEEMEASPGPLLVQLRSRRQAKDDKNKDRGSIGADVSHSPDGTRVRADGDYNVHTSKNGRTTVDARGRWERTYHGPRGNSRSDYNVGVGFRHRFGRN